MRIAAMVTSYNDPQATLACVRALLSQTLPLAAVLIVDNSKNQTLLKTDFVLSTDGVANVVVSHFPENIGIAGALHEGFHFAILNHCDYLWTFDQDSVPHLDANENLVAAIHADGQLHRGLYSCLAYDEGQQRFLFGYKLNRFRFEEIMGDFTSSPYTCDGTITSGMLIPVSPDIADLLPVRELFIDGVDHALCLSFLAIGQKVRVVPDSRLVHHMGQPTKGFLFKGLISRTVHNYSPLRKFYITRNHSYIETRVATREGVLFSALFWRIRVAYYMLRESLYERREWIWASMWSVAIGTLFGICGKLVPYNRLPRLVRKLS